MPRTNRQYPTYLSSTSGDSPPSYNAVDVVNHAPPGIPDTARSEHEPLLGSNLASRKPRFSWLHLSLIFVIITLAVSWGMEYHFNTDRPLNRKHIREKEILEHKRHLEHMDYEWGRDVQKRKIEEEERRKEWEQKVQERKTEEEERRKEWERKVQERKTEEEERHKEWEQNDQKRKSEEEERHKAAMFWAQLGVGKCESYNSRRYWSTLQHIPENYTGDRITACMETAARVHGREVKPLWCDDLGELGVWGNWVVDFDEPGCRPRWNMYKDNGCTAPGSGLREIEHHLEHFSLSESYDWRDVCIRAPADFNGRHFDGPDHCENWGSNESPNVFGYWRIEDESCR
ncbi:hypothetical protein BDQ17DRAFT_1415386 [Cyathus striatus]|nr:hypothetical protein BDQ17DRAFT_1415386 [Cyathus striatus]